MLDQGDLQRLGQLLVTMQRDIQERESVSKIDAGPVELDQSKVGRLSRMDAMQAQAMSQASGRRREHQQHSITAALSRLDRGEFGYCRECGEPIARKRLEFDPTAVLCIGCASNRERAEN